MTGLEHPDPVPQEQVLIVGSATDIQVGNCFISTVNSRKLLHRLKYIRCCQAGKYTKLPRLYFITSVKVLSDTCCEKALCHYLINLLDNRNHHNLRTFA